MTIPNLLTFARIFLTPLLAWFLLRRWMTPAFFVFFIAGLTDVLDGLLARFLNQKSRLGTYVDPLADKLLLVTSFVLLWKVGEVAFLAGVDRRRPRPYDSKRVFRPFLLSGAIRDKTARVEQADHPFSTGDSFCAAR